APATASVGCGGAPGLRPASTNLVSSSIGMAVPSTTAAWSAATCPGPQPATRATTIKTVGSRRRTVDLMSSGLSAASGYDAPGGSMVGAMPATVGASGCRPSRLGPRPVGRGGGLRRAEHALQQLGEPAGEEVVDRERHHQGL